MTEKGNYKEFEKKARNNIIDSFLRLDTGNMSMWSVYQAGIKKGINISLGDESDD